MAEFFVERYVAAFALWVERRFGGPPAARERGAEQLRRRIHDLEDLADKLERSGCLFEAEACDEDAKAIAAELVSV